MRRRAGPCSLLPLGSRCFPPPAAYGSDAYYGGEGGGYGSEYGAGEGAYGSESGYGTEPTWAEQADAYASALSGGEYGEDASAVVPYEGEGSAGDQWQAMQDEYGQSYWYNAATGPAPSLLAFSLCQ